MYGIYYLTSFSKAFEKDAGLLCVKRSFAASLILNKESNLMKSTLKAIVVFSLLAGILLVPPPRGRAQEKSRAIDVAAPLRNKVKTDELVARLERDLPQLMSEGDVPGLSIALVRDGQLAWHKGFGVKNAQTKEPVDDATIFEAASLTKPVFAYAVLKLVDMGKIDLDTPLNKYLPGNYDVADDARVGQITARRVLSHTTGFPNWRQPRDSPQLKMYFAPGERFSYSGEGFVYLAKVVEHLTGEKLEALMKRLVLEPLGMNSSSFVWLESYEKLKIFTHNSIGEPMGQNKVTKANAAGSLHTTAQDYGRFVAAILNGTGLKKETARLMLTPQIKVGESGVGNLDAAPAKLSQNVSWGLGWGLQSTKDGTAFWHWGDNGNTKAFIVAFVKQKTGMVVFTNSANGLSIVKEIVDEAVGGERPALAWLKYESYKSPGRLLFKSILAKGADTALREYRESRKGRAADEIVAERQMNRIGYDLLRMKKPGEAIEVFKLNVEDYPQSANVYDSLGEAYMVNGDKELAIKNYQKSVELNPNNTTGKEALKKLQEK
jgi:CubicO group peptidase (beta-lactamase class C family)